MAGDDATARSPYSRNKSMVIKSGTQVAGFITEVQNMKIDNANDLDIAMAMSNLLQYSNYYAKRSGS